jgi:hypothetical protein
MTLHATGPGRIEDNTNSSFLIARLYNFDTDGHKLKPEHIEWLDRVAVPRMQNASGMYVLGMASRLGRDEHNRRLSRRRKDEIVNYLSNKVTRKVTIHSDWAGESYAHGILENDQYDRAVIISIWPLLVPQPNITPRPQPNITPRPQPSPTPRPQPSPTPRPQPSPKSCTSTQFQIRMIQMGSFVVSTSATFEIEDLACQKRQVYRFKGLGPPLPGFPFSWTGTGPWNPFTTSRAITSLDFNGSAEINSITNPPGKGPNWTLLIIRPLLTFPIKFRNFKTGHSEGVGLTVSIGDFIRK